MVLTLREVGGGHVREFVRDLVLMCQAGLAVVCLNRPAFFRHRPSIIQNEQHEDLLTH